MSTSPPDWIVSDRLSDSITMLTNHELDRMRANGDIQPVKLLTGHLLALAALLKTMPVTSRPPTLDHLATTVLASLSEIAGHE